MKDLRDFINAIENALVVEDLPLVLCEETSVDDGIDLVDRLETIVFKLRAHSEPLTESRQGNYGLGVETGCEMAAEMIENLIRELGHQ